MNCVRDQNFIYIHAKLRGTDLDIVLVNIYAPCDRLEKCRVWSSLLNLRNSQNCECWCIMGDFNAVRCPEERKGTGGSSQHHRLESDDLSAL